MNETEERMSEARRHLAFVVSQLDADKPIMNKLIGAIVAIDKFSQDVEKTKHAAILHDYLERHVDGIESFGDVETLAIIMIRNYKAVELMNETTVEDFEGWIQEGHADFAHLMVDSLYDVDNFMKLHSVVGGLLSDARSMVSRFVENNESLSFKKGAEDGV